MIKLLLILIAPIVMFFYIKQSSMNENIQKYSYLRNNTWLMPVVVTIVWIIFYFFTLIGVTSSTQYNMGFFTLLLAALFSFLINSVLEELFYRVWLQTRLEALIGTWPAIIISSLLWAVWHMAIMGGDSYNVPLSTVMVNHGVRGLFLGFLWAKYRNVWILIIIHGIINWPTQLITGFF
ncbi:CPBP family intramembrane glutamic endopeptidase [Salinicoccus sp. YB14-2]|uniref:CPBP family intramembrane glutamic endopeptidase n=1 Tax=Salinicoccus sp. YB14-2 TaxID=1572701 RepID=UPI0012E20FE2|nr:CPBP family intramembrane glutamic endopeptidase [Salinicoccus sp. YB14-2]